MPYKDRNQQLAYLKEWRMKRKEKPTVSVVYHTVKKLEEDVAEKLFTQAYEEALSKAENEETENEETENEETENEETEDKKSLLQIVRQADALYELPHKYLKTPHGMIVKMIEEVIPHIDGWTLEKITKLAEDTFTDKELFIKRCYFLHLLNQVDTRVLKPPFNKFAKPLSLRSINALR